MGSPRCVRHRQAAHGDECGTTTGGGWPLELIAWRRVSSSTQEDGELCGDDEGERAPSAGEEMSDGVDSRMGVLSALSLSVTSSMAIVIWNKYFISTLGPRLLQ
jgi:hypothetical protein